MLDTTKYRTSYHWIKIKKETTLKDLGHVVQGIRVKVKFRRDQEYLEFIKEFDPSSIQVKLEGTLWGKGKFIVGSSPEIENEQLIIPNQLTLDIKLFAVYEKPELKHDRS